MSAGDFIIIALLFVLCAIPGDNVDQDRRQRVALAQEPRSPEPWSSRASVSASCPRSFVLAGRRRVDGVGRNIHIGSWIIYVYAIVPFLGFANGWVYPAQRNLLVA